MNRINNINRIDQKFNSLNGKKALITFVTAGDPSLEETENLVLSMLDAGADIVELGVPFSDPIAEGKTIQNASKRSLDNKTTLVKIFELVGKLREKTQSPLLLMMYLNSIFAFGTERFFIMCKDKGIDGVIVPDMPYEEKDEIEEQAKKYDIHCIRLVAPSSNERIKMIADGAGGFLYCISSLGVTGTRSSYSTDFKTFFTEIKKHAKIPCAVGFGISDSKQAKEMSGYCDGVIIGSKIVEIIEKEKENAQKCVYDFIKSIRMALDSN